MIARWRVFLGFVAAALFAVLSHVGSWGRLCWGLAIALAGLGLRAWAAGYLEKGKRLAQDGPYAFLRHPLYMGSFLLAVGFVLAGTSPRYPIHAYLLWGVFLFLFAWVYPQRIKGEEASLEQHFGDAWRAFVRQNSRFLPRLSPIRRENPDRFEWARYMKNHEYNAALGWLLGCIVLVAKAFLR